MKIRWSESHRQHNRTPSPKMYCHLRERKRSCPLLGLPQGPASVTRAGHRPTDTGNLRELTALTGLSTARAWGVRIWCLNLCVFVKHLRGCLCYTRAPNFDFFITKPTGAYWCWSGWSRESWRSLRSLWGGVRL